jgi:UDP-glucose 4-epimerase
VDVLVHAAAAAHEGLSVFSPAAIFQDTLQTSVAAFSAAIAAGARRIVLCSSMARYGHGSPPFTEDQPVAPVDPYGIAKVTSEALLRRLAEVHGVEWAIAVPHNIVGARQKYDDPYRNVASIMANLMLQGRQPFVYGDGEQVRCYSPWQDVVPCLGALALDPGMSGLVVNLGPEGPGITVNELARRLADLTGFGPLRPVYLEDRPCEVRVATCSAALARRRLGYRPALPLDASLAEIVAFIRQRGPLPFQYHIDLEIVSGRTPRTWRERLL